MAVPVTFDIDLAALSLMDLEALYDAIDAMGTLPGAWRTSLVASPRTTSYGAHEYKLGGNILNLIDDAAEMLTRIGAEAWRRGKVEDICERGAQT